MGKDLDIEKLRGSDNYHTWQFAMMSYLTYQDLDEAFETASSPAASGANQTAVTATNTAIASFFKKSTKAKAILRLCIESSLYVHVEKCESARVMFGIRLKRCLKMRILPERLGS